MRETQDWSFPPWWKSLLACAVAAAAVAAWVLTWRMLGVPHSTKDMASSSIGIALAVVPLALHYLMGKPHRKGDRAPEASSAVGLGRRILRNFEPLDHDRPGSNFPRMSSAALRAKVVVAVAMVVCLALPLVAAGVWESRLDIVLGGLVVVSFFSYFGASYAFTLRHRRNLGRS